jgi:hypothetical protein
MHLEFRLTSQSIPTVTSSQFHAKKVTMAELATGASILKHYSTTYYNAGVSVGIAEHSRDVLAGIRANWIENILNMPDTISVTFDGIFKDGHGNKWVREGALDNINIVVLLDHVYSTGKKWNGTFKRHHDIQYKLDYDVRVTSVPQDGVAIVAVDSGDEGKNDGDGPFVFPEIGDSKAVVSKIIDLGEPTDFF